MAYIYDQHRAAFRRVAAYVIAKDGKQVASIAFKFGGAVTAYVHWHGLEMVRAMAGGGGYDRQSAACAGAASKMPAKVEGRQPGTVPPGEEDRVAFLTALVDGDRGAGWDRCLRDAGFDVWGAL